MTRKFALITGALYIVLGVASLIPSLSTTSGLPPLHLEVSYGLFLGLFAQNIINKVAIIAFGVAGLLAYFSSNRSVQHSRLYARAVFVVMGLAALLGAVPSTSTFFGYWPLWGYEALLHGANALLGGYFGFVVATDKQGRLAHA